MTVARGPISDHGGSKHKPGDPWGKTSLVIALDGSARLDQDMLGGMNSYTGTVVPSALERFWQALDQTDFPGIPDLGGPAGSATRVLTIGSEPDSPTAHVPYHGAKAGYGTAFLILDTIIRQISLDGIKVVPPSDTIVEGAAPVSASMLTPGTAFLLAYLPWRRTAHTARLDLLDRNASTVDPALRHAIEFSRQALKVEDSMVGKVDARLAALATEAGVAIPPAPTASDDIPAWTRSAVRPHLTTPVQAAAWKAGEAARDVAVAAGLAAHLAYLRAAAIENADLRAKAADNAKKLVGGAATLKAQLEATGLPLVASHANNVAKMVSLTRNLEPTTTGGYRELNELARDVENFIEGHARQLDAAPPAKASSPPTVEEDALLARIPAITSSAGSSRPWPNAATIRARSSSASSSPGTRPRAVRPTLSSVRIQSGRASSPSSAPATSSSLPGSPTRSRSTQPPCSRAVAISSRPPRCSGSTSATRRDASPRSCARRSWRRSSCSISTTRVSPTTTSSRSPRHRTPRASASSTSATIRSPRAASRRSPARRT